MFYETPDVKPITFQRDPAIDFTDQDTAGSVSSSAPSSFGEVFRSSFDEGMKVRNLNSRDAALEGAYDQRIDKVRELTGQKLDNPFRFGRGGPFDFGERAIYGEQSIFDEFEAKVAEIVKNRPDLADQLQFPADIEAQANLIARKAAHDHQRALELYGPGWEKYIASFGGGMAAMAFDPLNALSMVFGFGGAKNTVQGLVAAASKNAGLNAGIELAQAVPVQQRRKDVGLDYGVNHAALDVLTAGVFGFGLDAAGRVAQRGVRTQVFGQEAYVDDKGFIIGWKKQGSPDPVKLTPEIITKAEEGDLDALKTVARETGLDEEPAFKGAIKAAEADEVIIQSAKESGLDVDDGSGLLKLTQAMRAVTDADEPPPTGDHLLFALRRVANEDRPGIASVVNDDAWSRAQRTLGATGERRLTSSNDNVSAIADSEGDATARFFSEDIGQKPGSTATAQEAYEAYVMRMEQVDATPMSMPAFSRVMSEKGFQKGKIAGRVRYVGIEVKDVNQDLWAPPKPDRVESFTANYVDNVVDLGRIANRVREAQPRSNAEARKIIGEALQEGNEAATQMALLGEHHASSILGPSQQKLIKHIDLTGVDPQALPRVVEALEAPGTTANRWMNDASRSILEGGSDERAGDVLSDRIRKVLGDEGMEGLTREINPPKRVDEVNGDDARAQVEELEAQLGPVDSSRLLFAISAEQAARAFETPAAQDALGYTSKAIEATRSLKQKKGTPEQMLAQLRKAGVKQSELDLMGVDDFLEGMDSVTRDGLVAFMELQRVPVMEARYGQITPQKVAADRGMDWESLDEGMRDFFRQEVRIKEDGLEQTTKWSSHSLDPSNPTYRETVLHLPGKASGDSDAKGALQDIGIDSFDGKIESTSPDDFFNGHFDEPNAISHLRTSMQPDAEGKQNFVINELQSDWGQKIRTDGGAKDEAKIAKLEADRDAALRSLEENGVQFAQISGRRRPVETSDTSDQARNAIAEYKRLTAELATASQSATGHPLVNTTDQWVNTSLRRALRQAVEDGADYIAISSGETVDSFRMGAPLEGLKYAYNEMYPKKLRDIIKKIDKDAAKIEEIDTLLGHKEVAGQRHELGAGRAKTEFYIDEKDGSYIVTNRNLEQVGDQFNTRQEAQEYLNTLVPDIFGFARFPLTDKLKQRIMSEGQPLFAVKPLADDLRQVAMENGLTSMGDPEAKALTPLAQRDMPALRAEIDKIVQRLPKGYRLDIEDRLVFQNDGRDIEVEAVTDPYERLIKVSLASNDPARFARHEEIHAYRQLGLFSDYEWNALATHARENNLREQYKIEGRYKEIYEKRHNDPDKLEEMLLEETIAEMWADRVAGKSFGKEINGVIDRIVRLLKRISDMLRGKGYNRIEDVYRRIESGEIGARAQQPSDDMALRFGADEEPITPGLDMSQEARLQRAREMGFDTETVLYHGSPDFREVKKAGGFDARTRSAENMGDPVEVKRLQDEMDAERAANGTSNRYFELLNEAAALRQYETIPQATYFTDNKGIAKTYTNEHRAFDFQNAESDLIDVYARGNLLDVSARGKKFSDVSIDAVRTQLPENLRSTFDDIVQRVADPTNTGKIRTGDMEVIASKLGFDGFRLRQVRDAYDGSGPPVTVVAVFDPSNIRSVNAAFDPAHSSSSKLLYSFAGEKAATADLEALSSAKTLEAEGRPRDEIWKDTGWFRGVDGKWRFEIDDSNVIVRTGEGELQDVMMHGRLFYADPGLAATDAALQIGDGSGSYSASEGIRATGKDGDELARTTLHEVQHGLQDSEGFGFGSNPEYEEELLAKAVGYDDDRALRELGTTDLESIAHQMYHRVSGEVEARTVERRMKLSPDQRRERAPWLDYDVPEHEQIVRISAKDQASMALAQSKRMESIGEVVEVCKL